MITQHDLQEAIAECQGEKHPNANTCIKLAAFLTIQEHLFPETRTPDITPPVMSYSYSPDPAEKTIDYSSGTEFGTLVHGRKEAEIFPIIDELVSEAVQALNPRLYDAFLRKLKN